MSRLPMAPHRAIAAGLNPAEVGAMPPRPVYRVPNPIQRPAPYSTSPANRGNLTGPDTNHQSTSSSHSQELLDLFTPQKSSVKNTRTGQFAQFWLKRNFECSSNRGSSTKLLHRTKKASSDRKTASIHPIIFVIGCAGTGKSDLGVAIAGLIAIPQLDVILHGVTTFPTDHFVQNRHSNSIDFSINFLLIQITNLLSKLPITAMSQSFSLFHLPKNALSHVLEGMEARSMFGLSLVSTKCKNLIKSLNLRANLFSVRISRDIGIHFSIQGGKYMFCKFYKELGRFQENEEPRRLGKPSFIVFTPALGESTQWKNEDYEFKEYIDHLKEIFHFKETYLTFANDAQRFDLESVYETFKCIKRLELLSSQSLLFNYQILKRFTFIKELWIGNGVFGNQKIPDMLLVQNFDTLIITARRVQVTLNELLSANSKYLALYNVRVSNEMLNKFLKCWMKGSNSRLEKIYLTGSYGFTFNKEVILKGLKYETVPQTEKRIFKYSSMLIEDIYGGFDIRRNDGTLATITLDEYREACNMFFWHN